MNDEIAEIKQEDILTISDLWRKSLVTDFFSILGSDFIEKIYFDIFKKLDKKIGFKITYEDQIVGFVLYGRFDLMVKSILKTKLFTLIYYAVKSTILNYKAIPIFFNVLIFILVSRKFEYLNDDNTELMVIGIHPNYQSKKFGTRLLNESIAILNNKNFAKEIYVKTQLKNPEFYQKSNFKIVNKIFGRVFLKKTIKT